MELAEKPLESQLAIKYIGKTREVPPKLENSYCSSIKLKKPKGSKRDLSFTSATFFNEKIMFFWNELS